MYVAVLAQTMAEMRPFAIKRHCVAVDGGGLTNPWVVNPTVIDGRAFVPFSRGDRNLAKAFGCPMGTRSPWGTSTFPNKLASIRDKAIDVFIAEAMLRADPETDETLEDIQGRISTTGRLKIYNEIEMPDILEIELQEFVTPEGEMVPTTTIAMLTTPKKNSAAAIELTEENLRILWLAYKSWPETKPSPSEQSADGDAVDDCHLDSHVVKWHKRKRYRPSLCVRWRDADGLWRRRFETPASTDDPELQQQLVQDTVTRLEKHYHDVHVPDPEGHNGGQQLADSLESAASM